MPKTVVQSRMIRALVYAGNVVLALGGGGVPTCRNADGRYAGVEAVIDKDLSSSLLATDIKADLFLILTGTEKVFLHYGTPAQRSLDVLTCAEARKYLDEGEFPPGSMGPKIRAALMYLEGGGREVIITTPEQLERALDGGAGTRIVWK
jgi:carbamate kinase